MLMRRLSVLCTFGLGLLLALGFVWASASHAAQEAQSALHVCANGCAYASVQAAVDAANPDDVIQIAAGVYTAATPVNQLAYITKSLTLRGGYSPDFLTQDPALYPTTLDAQAHGRVVLIDGSAVPGSITVTLDGLVLTNGYWTGGENIVVNELTGEAWYGVAAGGGVRAQSANLSILNSTISSNRTNNGLGSGLLQWLGSLTLQNSAVMSNTTSGAYGSVAPTGGGLCLFQVTATISQTAVLSNTASAGGYSVSSAWGGGLYMDRSTALIQDTRFQGNRATASTVVNSLGQGGGLMAERSNLTLLHSTFEANYAGQGNVAGEGGGVFLNANGAVVISRTLFLNNMATTRSTNGQGGGIYALGPALIDGNTFQGNVACTGGTFCDGGGAWLSKSLTFRNNAVISNTAGSNGGGAYLYNNSSYLGSYTLTAIGNLFQGNVVSGGVGVGNGGGVAVSGNLFNLLGNTLQDNTAGACGGGLYQIGPAQSNQWAPVDLQDGNLLQRNVARYGGGLCVATGYVGTTYQNLVVLDNQASVNGNGVYINHGGNFAGRALPFYHLTIGRNTGGDGAAVYVNQGTAAFVNTLIYNQMIGVQNASASTPTFDHTLRYQVLTPTVGIVGDTFATTADPALAADGYHLTQTSAAVDAGANTTVNDDVDGETRPQGQAPDIGADESPYTKSSGSTGFQISQVAGMPRWLMQWNPSGQASRMMLQQDYMFPFSYGGPLTQAVISTFALTDTFPAVLEPTRQEALPRMTFEAAGSQLTWRSTAAWAPGTSGWVGMVGQSDTTAPGQALVNTAQVAYMLAPNQIYTAALEATTQVPARPLLPPLLTFPMSGEMCLDSQNRLEARGLTGANMLIKVFENGAPVGAPVPADASGVFTVTWSSALTWTAPLNTVNLDAIACDPANANQCSAPSRTVHIDYPLGYWCPQRSYWEGEVRGTRFVFHFRNDQGLYATNDFQLQGVAGFQNTQLHLYSCCDSDTNPFQVFADSTLYTTGVQDPQNKRMWTFTIGAAHVVNVMTQCRGGGQGNGQVLIDPDGYVFDQTQGGLYDAGTGMFAPVQAVQDVTVTAFVSVPEWGGWMPWPAELYDHQQNPQHTGSDGYFAFFTPPGAYYLQVDTPEASGYQSWRSPVIDVITQIVHANVPLTPWPIETGIPVTLTPDGLSPAVVTVSVGSSVEWDSALAASATLTDLVSLTENPLLRPLSVRDPLLDVLGFDGGLLLPGKFYRRPFNQPGVYTYTDGAGHSGHIIVLSKTYLPLVRR